MPQKCQKSSLFLFSSLRSWERSSWVAICRRNLGRCCCQHSLFRVFARFESPVRSNQQISFFIWILKKNEKPFQQQQGKWCEKQETDLFFKKTPTEQLEAESQLDAPEATVPVSSEEKQESPVDEQQLEKKENETGATSGTISEETAAQVQHCRAKNRSDNR